MVIKSKRVMAQPVACIPPSRILIVDDHPMVREGLKMRIGNESDLVVCGEAETEAEALQLVRSSHPDLVIADLSLKSGHGMDLVRRIGEEYPAVYVLVLSMYDEVLYAERALRAGARGYLNKQEPQGRVIDAIHTVLAGNVFLTPEMTQRALGRMRNERTHADPVDELTDRELQIFEMLGHGMGTRQIAEQLNRSIHTVESHREKIKRKLGLDSANDLIQRAVKWTMEQDK